MMDTLGAIIGPITALVLLQLLQHDYARIFTLTVVPGLAAAAFMAFAVQERGRAVAVRERFQASLRALPLRFRRLLVAVGLFGLGDFAHTLLILLAVQQLTPVYGAATAVTAAPGLYILHNGLYAAFSMVTGAVADRMNKGRLLALGYALAGAMAVAIVLLPPRLWTPALIFFLGGVSVAVCETAEDCYCAELVDDTRHGMAVGTPPTVKGSV